MAILKRLLVGRPLATTEQEHQRIPKVIGLAVFSSDAISSTAYATEEILFVTAVGASSLMLGLATLIPIAIAVALLLAIVAFSYRQTIFAYPSGGGSYVVSRENLGENPSLVAAASLLVDYILTVAVSISAGVAAISSIPAFSDVAKHRVLVGIFLIVLITVANLRGIKESGRLFAAPTYLYIVMISALIIYGLVRAFILKDISNIPFDQKAFDGTLESGGTLGLFLILKGFSSGAVALTGVEAISNGVPAFKKPESKNAAATLVWMAVILGTLFMGISILAHHLQPYPSHDTTVLAQLGIQVFGQGAVFFVLQIATALILTLAANTAYADFPRLASIIAFDEYLPHQMRNRGDRLVFSNGVLILATAAIVLIVAFGGATTALIPLYAVGVFMSFTLSQAGMVRHHQKQREENWRRHAIMNGVGSVATLIVLVIVATTKFTSGAWVPLVLIPLIVLMFKSIRRHYLRVDRALEANLTAGMIRPRRNTVVVLVGNVHGGAVQALSYAKSLNPNYLVAVRLVEGDEEADEVQRIWLDAGFDIPLETVYSPYRELRKPLLEFLDRLDEQYENDNVTVIIPEFVVSHWWENILHNQSALRIKRWLLFRRGTMVTSVPYHID
ncbi:MAG: amino acid permease [Actinobacteria bacterium]|nr:APC family permease [Acidimicrobiia bacterium]PHX60263.1 MAG: amino acid permease [Actinomycetota bacterium]